jgi:hypothetical protein
MKDAEMIPEEALRALTHGAKADPRAVSTLPGLDEPIRDFRRRRGSRGVDVVITREAP